MHDQTTMTRYISYLNFVPTVAHSSIRFCLPCRFPSFFVHSTPNTERKSFYSTIHFLIPMNKILRIEKQIFHISTSPIIFSINRPYSTVAYTYRFHQFDACICFGPRRSIFCNTREITIYQLKCQIYSYQLNTSYCFITFIQ